MRRTAAIFLIAILPLLAGGLGHDHGLDHVGIDCAICAVSFETEPALAASAMVPTIVVATVASDHRAAWRGEAHALPTDRGPPAA